MVRFKDVIGSIKKRGQRVKTWHDRISFMNIFLLWAIEIISFALIYYFFPGSKSYLYNTHNQVIVNNLWNNIYFSFITATTTGFGDIIPFGFFKVLAIFEVILALLILAMVTSKLVSIKQDIILSEIYEISFNEKINRLRSSLLIFSQDLSRIINRIEDKAIRKREIFDLYIYVSSLEDTLSEILTMLTNKHTLIFKKEMNPLDTELMFNNIIGAFEKLGELVIVLDENKLEWKRKITISIIEASIEINERLFKALNTVNNNIPEKKLKDFNFQKNKIMDIIKPAIKEEEKKEKALEKQVSENERKIEELRNIKIEEKEEKEEEENKNDNLVVDVNKILDKTDKTEKKVKLAKEKDHIKDHIKDKNKILED